MQLHFIDLFIIVAYLLTTIFIGSFLSRALLDHGHTVRGLFLPTENTDTAAALGIEVHLGDLTRPETLNGIGEGVDTVFHLATRVLDWGSQRVFREIMVPGGIEKIDLKIPIIEFHNRGCYGYSPLLFNGHPVACRVACRFSRLYGSRLLDRPSE